VPVAATVGVRRGGVGLVAGRCGGRSGAIVAGGPGGALTSGGWVRWVGRAGSVRSSSHGGGSDSGSESSNEKRGRMHFDWFGLVVGFEKD